MGKHTMQLTEECTNKDCSKVFCRPVQCKELQNAVLKILGKYGDSLQCRKVMKTDFNDDELEKCIWIDSLIYVYRLIFKSQNFKTEPSKFSLKNAKMFKKIAISEKRDCLINKIRPCQDLNHSFCSILRKDITELEAYLLTGIIHFLLKKFQSEPDFNLAILIIRYFNILGVHGKIDVEYLNDLIKVFETVKNKIMNSLVVSSLSEHQQCTHGTCLLYFNLSVLDYKNSVKNIVQMIETAGELDIREDNRIYSLFQCLEQLNAINTKMNVIEPHSFVLQSFYNKINLKNELKFLKLNFESPLAYPFTVPLEIKADLLKIQNGDLMKNSLQEAFFRALFEGVTQPYLFVSIRRDKIYQDTLKIISELDECDVRKQLKVKFQGEEGIDSGGIKKEFFLLLGHEIENDISLFSQNNNRIWFRNGVSLQKLEAIGKLVGIALYNDVVLSVPFPSLLFKKLLRIPLSFEDLEEIEPEVYSSLLKLQECTTEELQFLEQNFTVDYDIGTEHVNCELFLGGRTVFVTKDNVNQFISMYFQFITEDAIYHEFEAFAKGFYSIVKFDILKGLSARELEKVIMGCDEIDYQVIRKNTVYNGYTDRSTVIEDFWQFFSELKIQKKRKLIQFITGNDRLPVGGSNALNLVIMRNGCDTDRLPSSQTCFNTLLLPEYSNFDKLKEKMCRAIEMTAGFFLM